MVGGLGKGTMQRLLTEETEKRNLLARGAGMVARNTRYIFWFYVLNLTLAEFGTAAFRNQAHSVLDHSLYADRLVHGLDLTVLIEMVARPDFGPLMASAMPAMYFVVLFFVATALFLPGVFQGYASTYRLPREDFFRACGRNLWRFIRLMMICGLVALIVGGALFGLRAWLVKIAGENTYELLPFSVSMTGLAVIFFVMTTVRIWFDLAEADVVLSDQRAVRKSIGLGFRHAFRSWGRLLASYVVITILAAALLAGGLWAWMKYVPPDNVLRAFLIGQLALLLLLIPRFWQRGVAVAYYQQEMAVPVVEFESTTAEPLPVPLVIEPVAAPEIPSAPTGTEGS